jgi:hypothetical protein
VTYKLRDSGNYTCKRMAKFMWGISVGIHTSGKLSGPARRWKAVQVHRLVPFEQLCNRLGSVYCDGI